MSPFRGSCTSVRTATTTRCPRRMIRPCARGASFLLACLVLLTISPAQTPPPAGADADEFRTWTDGSGQYQTEAVLMGIASHDVLTANLIHEKALTRGLGTVVDI